jgi:LPS sulfotransferase NodH
MSAYLKQFGPEMDLNTGCRIRSALVIASSQRSGSSLLGHYLAATGKFGVPLEYFNVPNLRQWRQRFGVDTFTDLLDAVEPLRTSENGIFSLKCHYFQLRAIGSIPDLITRYGDCRFVRIRRRDLVAQAVSRTIASQTGVWISGQARTGEAVYDRSAIARNLRLIAWQDSHWPLAFSIAGVPWIEVEYELLVENAAKEIRRIADHAGVELSSADIPEAAPLTPQGMGLTQAWADRFRKDNPAANEKIVDFGQGVGQGLKALLRDAFPAAFDTRKEAWRRSPNLAGQDRREV